MQQTAESPVVGKVGESGPPVPVSIALDGKAVHLAQAGSTTDGGARAVPECLWGVTAASEGRAVPNRSQALGSQGRGLPLRRGVGGIVTSHIQGERPYETSSRCHAISATVPIRMITVFTEI